MVRRQLEHHGDVAELQIGIDEDGNQVGITAETPQIILATGATGWGKSHVSQVIAEGASFNAPGLSTLETPQRTARFESTNNHPTTRRQMLSGFYPNGNPEQLAWLHEHFGYKARGNEAYRRGKLFVLPPLVAECKVQLAHLVERGLEVLPILLGPQDVGMAGYRGILANARCMQGGQIGRASCRERVSSPV